LPGKEFRGNRVVKEERERERERERGMAWAVWGNNETSAWGAEQNRAVL